MSHLGGSGLPEIDTSRAHPARVYDYLLGGKDNFPADQAVAEQVLAAVPTAGAMARANRAFLQRAVRFLAADHGIRQFLDIGTGLPTQGNVHEIAQDVAPDARVVYVDNDPIVHVHANALLAGNSTTVMLADLRQPEAILQAPKVREVLDFDQPIAVLLVAILHFIRDDENPAGIVRQLRDAIAPGSALVISHATADLDEQAATAAASAYDQATSPLTLRRYTEILRLVRGFNLVRPGLVPLSGWRPDPHAPDPGAVWGYGGVGWKRGPRRAGSLRAAARGPG